MTERWNGSALRRTRFELPVTEIGKRALLFLDKARDYSLTRGGLPWGVPIGKLDLAIMAFSLGDRFVFYRIGCIVCRVLRTPSRRPDKLVADLRAAGCCIVKPAKAKTKPNFNEL